MLSLIFSYLQEGLRHYLFMLPIFIPISILFCFLYKKNRIPITPWFIVGQQLFMYLLAIMLTVTGAGSIRDIGRYGNEIIRLEEINLIPFVGWGLSDIFGLIMNLLMFLPLGVLIPLLWKDGASFLQTAIAGFEFSLLIEISQLFDRRATDIDDLIMNTLGAMLGFLVYKLIFRKLTLLQVNNQSHSKWVRYSAHFTLLLVFLGYFFIGSPLIAFFYRKIYGF